ncbi:MAG: hypothetical protein IT376_18670 [Polyangiaceae bacterium]|nr:hypothetical protein [Polyangiaceae bacterium]
MREPLQAASDSPPASGECPSRSGLRLVEVLRALPEGELPALISRLNIVVDEAKRIDVPTQVARSLVALPELRDPSQLEPATRELLLRVAEARGVLAVAAVPDAAAPLLSRGVLFRRDGCRGTELLLPVAHQLLLRSWEGDDPRGIRALLAQCSPEVAGSMVAHYTGRPSTPPVVLGLELVWEIFEDSARLRAEIDQLAPLERKLLRSIEKVGGEVETDELLDLEREPMRLRGATGATPSRRGVGFALERRGFLIPVHPNRHVVPTEVAAIVGAATRAERDAQRREIASRVLSADHAPRRARFAVDPVPLALATAMSVRDPTTEVRPGVGTPRSLLARFAGRFGRDADTVALLAALSRAIGLWDRSAVDLASPPGSLRVGELGYALFAAWSRGGAWDEARPDGEVLRVSIETREASTGGVIRELVLDALRELGDDTWAPWEAVASYVRADGRIAGLARLLERWALRNGLEPTSPLEVARRVATVSLPALGIVDLGDLEPGETELEGPALRLTPRGRAFLAAERPSSPQDGSRYLDSATLRVGRGARVGAVLACAQFVELGSVGGELDLVVTPASIALALAAGVETDTVREQLEALAGLPDPVARVLAQASAVVGRAELARVEAFLWVEDPEVRELLRTRRQTADLFLDPSPPSGLLVAPGVELDRLARRMRSLGVELVVDGDVYRTRSTIPGRSGSSTSIPAVQAPRKPSTTRPRARRSSHQIPAKK